MTNGEGWSAHCSTGPPRHLAASSAGPVFLLRPDVAVVSAAGAVDWLLDAKWSAWTRAQPGAASPERTHTS